MEFPEKREKTSLEMIFMEQLVRKFDENSMESYEN